MMCSTHRSTERFVRTELSRKRAIEKCRMSHELGRQFRRLKYTRCLVRQAKRGVNREYRKVNTGLSSCRARSSHYLLPKAVFSVRPKLCARGCNMELRCSIRVASRKRAGICKPIRSRVLIV